VALDIEDIIDRYIERFGEEPEFTGISWTNDFPVEEIMAAINTGIPYKEISPPAGVKT